MSQQEQQDKSQYFYRASAADFLKIPDCPVAYWASPQMLINFENETPLGDLADVKRGMTTSDNNQFIRFWPEVSFNRSYQTAKNDEEAVASKAKWFPYSKGGGYRKWYGFMEFFINWEESGRDVINFAKTINQSYTRTIVNVPYYFLPSVGFSYITSGPFSMRWIPEGALYDSGGPGVFADEEMRKFILACMNSTPAMKLLKILNPTINLQIADVVRLPIPAYKNLGAIKAIEELVPELVNLSKSDWDSYETSWNFTSHPFISVDNHEPYLKSIYRGVRGRWEATTLNFKSLETENNRFFIEAYGLQKELVSEVPPEEITLTCNPYYRYGANRSEPEYEALLQCDTLKELLSYTIGCMMGRYSIDKPGLILASQGETLQDYLNQIPNPRFMPDSDAILPLTDQEWFTDDVTNRVREFVKVVWGEETLQENLAFIAESLCLHAIKQKKGEGAMDTIRRYLSTQFYKDHLKTYKKRPIYWLFSSGKEKAFECLVYLHRYNESTLARMRTEYVTPLMGKYDAQHSLLLEQKTDASPAQQRELEKELKALEKKQTELRAFDEQLKHYADMRFKLDLDDGVKVNYGKFGNLLAEVKAVTGDKGE